MSKKQNNFTSGCSDMQRSALSRHAKCVDHVYAQIDVEQRKTMVAAKEKLYSREEKAVIGALRTTYWLAKEEIASNKLSLPS